MKAVAESLGVDRKSLNYYVSDRDGLLELVALDAFESHMCRLAVPADVDWRDMLRSFAEAVVESLTKVGVLIVHVRFRTPGGLLALSEVERIVQAMVAAGFRPLESGRTLRLVADIAYIAARETVQADREPAETHAAQVRRTLDSTAGEGFPLLRQAADRAAQSGAREQFAFDLELVIAGLERKLETRLAKRHPESANMA